MNSTKQFVNSEPMWGYCSRAKKNKKKTRGREKTRKPNGHIGSVWIELIVAENWKLKIL